MHQKYTKIEIKLIENGYIVKLWGHDFYHTVETYCKDIPEVLEKTEAYADLLEETEA